MKFLFASLLLSCTAYSQTQDYTTRSYYPGHLQITPQGGSSRNYTTQSFYPGHLQITPQGGTPQDYTTRSFYPGHTQVTPQGGIPQNYTTQSFYPGHLQITPQGGTPKNYTRPSPPPRQQPLFKSGSTPQRAQNETPRNYTIKRHQGYTEIAPQTWILTPPKQDKSLPTPSAAIQVAPQTWVPAKSNTHPENIKPVGKYTALYNEYGYPLAFIDDSKILYSWDGSPSAILSKTNKRNYDYLVGINGEFVGFGFNGMILDENGMIILASKKLFPFGSLKTRTPPPGKKEFKRFEISVMVPKSINFQGWNKHTNISEFLLDCKQ